MNEASYMSRTITITRIFWIRSKTRHFYRNTDPELQLANPLFIGFVIDLNHRYLYHTL